MPAKDGPRFQGGALDASDPIPRNVADTPYAADAGLPMTRFTSPTRGRVVVGGHTYGEVNAPKNVKD